MGDLETYFADNEFIQAFIDVDSDFTMTEQFITLLMAIMSLFGLVPAVMVILKIKGEETKNLTENYYTRAISRNRVLGSHFLLAIVLSVIMQSLIALGLWSVGVFVMDEVISFVTTFVSAYIYLPAIWVVVSLIIGLIGVVPRLTGLIWLYVVFCFVVVYLGDLFGFPEWMKHLSVFEYIPQIPVDDVNVMALMVLILITVGLSVIGFIGYSRRDISG